MDKDVKMTLKHLKIFFMGMVLCQGCSNSHLTDVITREIIESPIENEFAPALAREFIIIDPYDTSDEPLDMTGSGSPYALIGSFRISFNQLPTLRGENPDQEDRIRLQFRLNQEVVFSGLFAPGANLTQATPLEVEIGTWSDFAFFRGQSTLSTGSRAVFAKQAWSRHLQSHSGIAHFGDDSVDLDFIIQVFDGQRQEWTATAMVTMTQKGLLQVDNNTYRRGLVNDPSELYDSIAVLSEPGAPFDGDEVFVFPSHVAGHIEWVSRENALTSATLPPLLSWSYNSNASPSLFDPSGDIVESKCQDINGVLTAPLFGRVTNSYVGARDHVLAGVQLRAVAHKFVDSDAVIENGTIYVEEGENNAGWIALNKIVAELMNSEVFAHGLRNESFGLDPCYFVGGMGVNHYDKNTQVPLEYVVIEVMDGSYAGTFIKFVIGELPIGY